MSTLVLSGFGCPSSSWKFLGDGVSLSELLIESKSSNLNKLAALAAQKIEKAAPEVLVLHDFGVVIGFLALQKLLKNPSTISSLKKIIFFNGAVRGFDVFKNRHPFTMQFAKYDLLQKAVKKVGGELDPAFEKFLPQIKALYRQVIAFSLLQKLKGVPRSDRRILKFNGEIHMILSTNDPFISKAALDQLIDDLKPNSVQWIEYGHFPYSIGEPRIGQIVSAILSQPS